jgi:hypothetical protein
MKVFPESDSYVRRSLPTTTARQLSPTLGVRCLLSSGLRQHSLAPLSGRRAYFLNMMQACRRAAGALASTSLPADTLRASLPAACQRLYHKNVRSPAGARAAPARSGRAAWPDVTSWSLLAVL